MEFILTLVLTLLILLISVTVHEFAHNLVAYWWGDPTPREMNKLTLNPMAHVSPQGWAVYLAIFILMGGLLGDIGVILVILLFIFMYTQGGRGMSFMALGQAYISPHRMRNPRWGSFWSTAAGPISNFLLAIAGALLLRLFFNPLSAFYLMADPSRLAAPIGIVAMFLMMLIYYNLLLGFFNLIPLFPLDGWRMMLSILPGQFLMRKQVPVWIQQNMAPLSRFLQEPAFQWQRWAQASQMVFLILILISFLPGIPSPLDFLISEPTIRALNLLLGF
ncbi:site-2 protease family protein [Phototrophicus methaneseepsis]|uniref:Site-2 protease family protein n=1 Tax=Phototrophicus methaneseepsis TaxID=2710758 RepID=A0A7S8EDA7_9CHLR|nr:site-2 protease family protein [Phototrophicus methaneseepsis]QPC84846.1 site-2 protease family protein [Phototrophicus methaneseepsis]